MITGIFGRPGPSQVVNDIYNLIVQKARDPKFYQDLSVPDTIDGRFEMISLHVFLVLRRLRRSSKGASQLSQALFDYMFEDMDLSLREMGAGDMGVGKRVKTMMQAFYGRVASYEEGLTDGAQRLEAALIRNVYGTVNSSSVPVQLLAEYVLKQDEHLRALDLADVESARFDFGALP